MKRKLIVTMLSSRLPRKLFQGLTNLTSLDLRHNAIDDFSLDLSTMMQLSHLLLGYNNIGFLPKPVRDQIDQMLPTVNQRFNRLDFTNKYLLLKKISDFEVHCLANNIWVALCKISQAMKVNDS